MIGIDRYQDAIDIESEGTSDTGKRFGSRQKVMLH